MANAGTLAVGVLASNVFQSAKASGLIPERHSYSHNQKSSAMTNDLIDRMCKSAELRAALRSILDDVEVAGSSSPHDEKD